MPLFELGVILTNTIDEQEREAFLGELKALLTKEGATIVKEDVWGKRMLAYEIKHQREGFYVFWQYEGPGTVVKPLEYRLRLSEQVLLHLNLDREMQRSRKMERVRAEQKAAKREARAAAAAAAAAAAPASQEA
jgi:small subunit ribosomal protein S6